MKYVLIADGGKKDGLAYGSFRILNDRGVTVSHRQFIVGPETHNQAEYRALNRGLERCVELELEEIEVFMDSKLVVNQVNEEWRCLDHKLKLLKKETESFLSSLNSVNIQYMPRRFIEQKLGH